MDDASSGDPQTGIAFGNIAYATMVRIQIEDIQEQVGKLEIQKSVVKSSIEDLKSKKEEIIQKNTELQSSN